MQRAFGLEAPLFTQFIQQFQDMHDLERVAAADEVRTFPAQGHVGMTALGADDLFHLEAFRRGHDAAHQFRGDVRGTDLDAAVGGLEGIGGQGPAHTGVVEDAGHR